MNPILKRMIQKRAEKKVEAEHYAQHNKALAFGVINNIAQTTPGGFRPSKTGWRVFWEAFFQAWAVMAILAGILIVATVTPDRSRPEPEGNGRKTVEIPL